jgi:opacity protein-like surface antigen
MKKILLATVALLGFTTAAMAEDPMKADRSGAYVAGNMGGSNTKTSQMTVNGAVGYQVLPYARVELDFDHAFQTNGAGNMVTANAIGQYRIPSSSITPYVLAGAGMGLDKFGSLKKGGSEKALYNVGAGVRVAVSQSVDLDVRYRNVRPFEAAHVAVKDRNLFTAGVGYRF